MVKRSIDSHTAISLYLDIDDEDHEKALRKVFRVSIPKYRASCFSYNERSLLPGDSLVRLGATRCYSRIVSSPFLKVTSTDGSLRGRVL